MNTISDPFRSSISLFLEKRLKELEDSINHRDIAIMAGFKSSDIIYMFVEGRAKVPLDRVTKLAQALGCDAAHLFILALEQNFEPAMFHELRELFTRSQNISSNELAWIQLIRDASGYTDPSITLSRAQKIRREFQR
jgi:hypothetical protein